VPYDEVLFATKYRCIQIIPKRTMLLNDRQTYSEIRQMYNIKTDKTATQSGGVYFYCVQKWENALLEHISYSLRVGGRVIDDDKDDEVLPLGCLQDSLRVGVCHNFTL